MASGSQKTSRNVSSLLDALRDEHIRNKRNTERKPGALPRIPNFTFNDRSLPLDSLELEGLPIFAGGYRSIPHARRRTRADGYRAPASWLPSSAPSASSASPAPRNLSTNLTNFRDAEWRFNAFYAFRGQEEDMVSHLLGHKGDRNATEESSRSEANHFRDGLPSLFNLSMHALLSTPDNLVDIHLLPDHPLRILGRFAAIHRPELYFNPTPLSLSYDDDDNQDAGSSQELTTWTFLDVVGGREGELVFVGDGNERDVIHVKKFLKSHNEELEVRMKESSESWDDEEYVGMEGSSIVPLTSIHLMRLPINSLDGLGLILPRTVTRFSFLDASTTKSLPKLLHGYLVRLSRHSPLLQTLDLSFNPWVTPEDLYGMDWTERWTRLREIRLEGMFNSSQKEEADQFRQELGQHITNMRSKKIGLDCTIEVLC